MKRYLKLSIVAILLVLVTTGYFELRNGHAKPLSRPLAQQTENVTRTVQVTGTLLISSEQ
jgi:hypothetical protein